MKFQHKRHMPSFFSWYWHISSKYVPPVYIYIQEYVSNPILSRTVFYQAWKILASLTCKESYISFPLFLPREILLILACVFSQTNLTIILSTLSSPKCYLWYFHLNPITFMDKYVGHWTSKNRSFFFCLSIHTISCSVEFSYSYITNKYIFITNSRRG